MHPFFGPEGRRAIISEIAARIRERLNADPVSGFVKMLDPGNAVTHNDRYSGFRSRHVGGEWLVRLSAANGPTWQSAPVEGGESPSVAFLLDLGFGNGSPLPQPSGAWRLSVNGRHAITFRNVNHSQAWYEGDCAMAFTANRIESAAPYAGLTLSALIRDESVAAFGPAVLRVPREWVETGQPAVLSLTPVAEAASTRWVQVSSAEDLTLCVDIWQAVQMLVDGRGPRMGDYRVYFGDIHTHSGQVVDRCENGGCGSGSRVENYEYARGPAGIDFYSLTDHEWQVDPDDPGSYLALADHYDEPGRFVCIPGFEFTNLLYGHRNVYFRDSGGTIVNTNREPGGYPTIDPAKCRTTQELWDALEKNGVPFITVPHHSSATDHPLNLDIHDPRYDRLFEIYSSWGSSEYYGDFPRGNSDRWPTGNFQDSVRRGQRMGLIGSSDGHDGHPGNAQSPLRKHHHIFHFCGSGRAAVLVPELTRAEVYDALHARRCYATTGPPILLDVRVCGQVMGSEAPEPGGSKRPDVRVNCIGANGIDHVRIVKNGEVVHTEFCHGRRECELEWEDVKYNAYDPACYYVRVVQRDLESAWSSPVWIG